jgi:flagellar protein FlaG
MGFSLTGTHVVYFIVAVIIASAVSGVFVAVINDVTTSFSERGDRVQDQLDTEFSIINDPDNIPSDAVDYKFYIKNIGGGKIATTNTTFQIFIDGDLISADNYNFSDSSIQTESVTTLYILKAEITAGDHKIRLVGPQAVEDEIEFSI